MSNEILGMDHIALIVSSENSVKFYETFGFKEIRRVKRVKDTMVFMENSGIVLELFIDPEKQTRPTEPEAFGLRHLCFIVENVDDFTKILKCRDVFVDGTGRRTTFTNDPDGLPIELKEPAR